MADAADRDLVVIGGLTVDEFGRERTEPGGAVLHATRAATAAGYRVAVATSAGPEAEAQAGLAELARRGGLASSAVPASIRFGHEQVGDRRQLVLRAAGSPVRLPTPMPTTGAVLLAPVAGEVPTAHIPRVDGVRIGAALQGWLREPDEGGAIRSRPIEALDPLLREGLAAADVVIASLEDLDREELPVAAQVARIRSVLGRAPIVALTDGRRGAWLDDRGMLVHVPPPRTVDDVASTGAGDAWAAVLLAELGRGSPLRSAAERAAWEVVRFLRRRRRPRFAVGDLHGYLDRARAMLAHAGLVDGEGRWAAGTAELWFLGDLTDRGPDGVGVIDLVRGLERDAAAAGGRVTCLLGNHELLLLAARIMPEAASDGPGGTMRSDWLANGGRDTDLRRLTASHVDWLRARPAAALVEEDLLVHADARAYGVLGRSVAAVNARVAAALDAEDPGSWNQLIGAIAERRAFVDPLRLQATLQRFGAVRVVHGHTPVAAMTGQEPAEVDRPFVYASGRAVAADSGLFLGGRGFVVEL